MKDRERIEQLRLRERIGSYHKYVDNALVNNPDPTSSHFLPGINYLVTPVKITTDSTKTLLSMISK